MSKEDPPSLLTLALSALRFRYDDKRQLLGLMTLGLLLIVGGIWISGMVAASLTSMVGPLFRACLVLGALWLAWPQLARVITKIPQWLGAALVAILLVGIVRPTLLYVVIPLALALWFIGPMLARRLDNRPQIAAPPPPRKRPAKPRAAKEE